MVTREGDHWLADVPLLQGAHTHARSLPTLDRSVREVIALAADLPDEAMPGLSLVWEYHTGSTELDGAAAAVRIERARIDAEARTLTERTADLARTLVRDHGLSVRDAAAVLGVSPQRIGQLVPGGTRKAS